MSLQASSDHQHDANGANVAVGLPIDPPTSSDFPKNPSKAPAYSPSKDDSSKGQGGSVGSSNGKGGGQICNIIAFGETGVGKSSLIKMLCHSTERQPIVSGEMSGCTTGTAGYWIPMENTNSGYMIWDTPGMNEGESGTVTTQEALLEIYRLVDGLSKRGQCVNLLIYCIRASEFRPYLRVNYDLVAKTICEKNVPVVAVVNGLENEENMEDWWKRNHKPLEKDMKFKSHVCVTTTMGKQNGDHFVFQKEYEESRKKVKEVIKSKSLTKPWTVVDFDTFDANRKKYLEDYNSRTEKERSLVARFIKKMAKGF